MASVSATRWHVAALAAIVVASFAFRVHLSRYCSLWLDEVWTRHDAAVPWPDLLRGPSREHPPLMFVLVRLSTAFFGTSELALRAPSLFFGCVLLVAVYGLCLELELGATEALVVVAALALAPFFVEHATEARHYAIFPAFITLATLFTLRLLRNPRDFAALVGFALSAAAAAATHYFGLAYAGALLGALALARFSAWRGGSASLGLTRRDLIVWGFCALALGLIAFQAISLAGFYSSHRVGPQGRDLFGHMLQEFSFFRRSARAARSEPFVALVGLLLLGRRLRGIARLLPVALAFVPCGAALLISSGHAVAPRYLAPSFVFYQLGATIAVLELYGLVRGNGGLTWWSGGLAGLAGLALVAAFGARLAEYPAGYSAGRNYYAGLQAHFHDEPDKDTGLIVFPHFPGAFIVGLGYPVDAPVQSLESYQPIPGIKRYVLAEFQRPSQGRELESELAKHFHLSPRQQRMLPLVTLPKTKFQPAVRARLLRVEP